MQLGRDLIIAVRNSTPDECREMGELLLSLADSPRGALWKHNLDLALARFPEPPQGDLADLLVAAKARMQKHNDELWDSGWHPTQMRRKLEELGYSGSATA